LVVGLVVANASLLMTLPWLQAGAWADTEMVGAVLHAAGAVTMLGLALSGRPAARAAATHPFVLLPLGLGVWSALGAPFAEFPGLALLGPSQTSQGALWFLDLAAFTAAFLVVRDHTGLRRAAVSSLAAAALFGTLVDLRHFPKIQAGMARLGLDPGWSLFAFNDFLMYYAGALVVLGVAFWRTDRAVAVVALVAGPLALAAADSRTALISALLVVPPTALAIWAARRGAAWASHRATTAGLALLVALIVVGAYPAIRAVPHGAGLDTVWSRAILGRVIEPAIATPHALAIGNGWGHFQQSLVRNIDSAGVRLYQSEWFDIERDEFHSHNAPLESLFSAGVPGYLLTLAMSVALVLFAAPERRLLAAGFAVFMALLDALWFQLPVTLAGLGMAAAALAGRPAPPGRRAIPAVLALALAAGGLAWGSTVVARSALTVERWKACLPPAVAAPSCRDVTLPADPRGTQVGLAFLLNDAIPAAAAAAEAGTLTPDSAAFLHRTLDEAAAGVSTSGLSLALALNNAYGLWATAPAGALLALTPAEAERWAAVVAQVQASAPRRPDLLVPYVSWLLAGGREAEASAVVARSERTVPHHPVVVWFRGVLSLGLPDERARAAGLAQMRAALRDGVERYLPVPPEVKASLAPAAEAPR